LASKYRLLLAGLIAAPLIAFASPPASPDWAQLSAEEQTALAPLARDWDRFSPAKKQQMLNLVDDYQGLDAVQRQRLQARLKGWSELTPQQQDEARANWRRGAIASARRSSLTLTSMACRWSPGRSTSWRKSAPWPPPAVTESCRITPIVLSQ
jgi:hypothetical protein